jgi:hypothetical protein
MIYYFWGLITAPYLSFETMALSLYGHGQSLWPRAGRQDIQEFANMCPREGLIPIRVEK